MLLCHTLLANHTKHRIVHFLSVWLRIFLEIPLAKQFGISEFGISDGAFVVSATVGLGIGKQYRACPARPDIAEVL